jgi:hypothetical protein
MGPRLAFFLPTNDMPIETWLKKTELSKLIPALRDDCKLLQAALQGEAFDFDFDPLDSKWQSFVANLKVPGTVKDQDRFDAKDLFQSRLGLIRWYQRGFADKGNSDASGLEKPLEDFVRSIEIAWSYKKLGAIASGQPIDSLSEPAWIRSIEAKSQKIATAIWDFVKNKSPWSHPGVLMACDLLMKLMQIDRQPELEVRTKVMFAFEHPREPRGILANLVIERLPNGSGLLIPNAANCGLLWMPDNQGDSFSIGLQTAWAAARKYLQSKQTDWRVPHEDSGNLLSYDWRWRLDLSGLHESLPRLGWRNPIVPINGRSAETAIACALIAAAKHNPDSAGSGDSKDMDPLDPNIACTATIDLSREDLPLGIVADIKTKTLLSEEMLAKERIYEVIVSDQQPSGTIPDNDTGFKPVPVRTLADAYEQMVIYPRITRGVNRAIAAESKKYLDTYCTPYITPDIADVNLWQQAASEEPAKFRIYPPTEAILDEETLRELMAGRLKYEPVPSRISEREPRGNTKAVTLQGNRIFIEGESGLGKSMFLLRCQYQIASTCDSLCLPVRFGKTRGNDSSLSQINWSGLTTDELLTLKQVSLPVEMFNLSLSAQKKPIVPRKSIVAWMNWLMERGRVVLLLDALDQTHFQGVQQLGPKIAKEGWRQCPVIMSGRQESKYDRRSAISDNFWHNLRLVPFDKTRWSKYLGEDYKNTIIDSALLSVPLLLGLSKKHFGANKSPVRAGRKAGSITKTMLYDEAVKEMIEIGFINLEQFKPELRNCFKGHEDLTRSVSEIAWYMYKDSQLLNNIERESYKEIENLIGRDKLEALDSFQITSSSNSEEEKGRSRLSFRHQSFFEYFLATYLIRKPFNNQSSSSLERNYVQSPISDDLSDEKWIELFSEIHDSETQGDSSTSLNEWSNIMRFLLSKAEKSSGKPPFESVEKSLRSTDWIALRLIECGNPWIVLEVDELEKGTANITKSIIDLCQKLSERFWFIGFDGQKTTSFGNVEHSGIKNLLENEIDLTRLVDRRFRDAGYLSSLRELVDSKFLHVAYNNDCHLLESIKTLPSGDGSKWNYLESFTSLEIQRLDTLEKAKLWISDFPVTNSLFELFCPSHRRYRNQYSSLDDDPVVYVSWWMALEFLEWLTSISGKRYRLPNDFEWELAVNEFGIWKPTQEFDTDSHSLYWHESSRSKEGTRSRGESYEIFKKWFCRHPARMREHDKTIPMDLIGNVWEWMANCDPGETPPLNPIGGDHRLLKGGCWVSKDEFCNPDRYELSRPQICNQYYGFRAFHSEQSDDFTSDF